MFPLPPVPDKICGDIGGRIRWVLKVGKLKQTELARALGVSANYIYLFTSGWKTAISEPLARLMESLYGCPAQWLLTGVQPDDPGDSLRKLRGSIIGRIRKMDQGELQAAAEFIGRMKYGAGYGKESE
ncbi:MAG: helix-turn-helix transcriptional regulator [Oscillospiraceae bacterium]|nr:helix-turn-helix transcriptional regulator [Oscillospiraceae bacterium]